jgi:hypothetical protein
VVYATPMSRAMALVLSPFATRSVAANAGSFRLRPGCCHRTGARHKSKLGWRLFEPRRC